jgi:hypothetical protein
MAKGYQVSFWDITLSKIDSYGGCTIMHILKITESQIYHTM